MTNLGLDTRKMRQNNINHSMVPTQHTLQENYNCASPSGMRPGQSHSSTGQNRAELIRKDRRVSPAVYWGKIYSQEGKILLLV